MKNLGLILTIGGAIAGIWGFFYTSNHEPESIGELFGVMGDTYKLANTLGPLGVIVAIIGIVLWVVAANQKK